MLNYMVPWLKNIELNASDDNVFVMDILFRATVDYGTQYADQITKAWVGLTFKKDNIPIVLDYVLRRCEYDLEYDKWVAIEASKRIALYCSRTCRKYTIQELIKIINKQSIDVNEFDDEDDDDDISDVATELPEDPRTSLSTPAPPPYKRHNNNINNNSKPQQTFSPFRSPMFNREQLQLIQNVGFSNNNDINSDDPSLFTDEIRRFNAIHEYKVKHSTKSTRNKFSIMSYDINNINNNNNDTRLESTSITKGDYALMLLVELAYEMDPSDDDFTENIALMLHVAILGLDHPFRSLGEHCKRLLMNLIHSIYFRDNNNNNKQQSTQKPQSAQELMLYLVSRRGKLMWQREIISPRQLFLTSSRYLQFLVQWLIDVITDKKCENAAQFWGNAAIEWVKKCNSSFIACRSIQIYRSLQRSFKNKFNKEVFDTLMDILQDSSKFSLWPEILILMKTWTIHIPTTEINIWCKLIWNCINICKYEPSTRPHVYVHGLSLLASILQFLDLSNHSHGNIWDHVLNDINQNLNDNPSGKRNEFDGIQSFVVKGLLCDITRKQSEEFLSGLTLMDDHEMISKKNARIHMTVIAQIPSICNYLQQNINMNIQQHMQNMSRSIATLFFQLNMRDIALAFDNIHTLDVDKFLSKTLKPMAQWISLTPSADINTVRLLLDLLDHTDNQYRRHVLCVLHGILLWIDWDESELSDVDSNFFDRITDLLATNLWREATMILEVVVKFNNNSSESPSLLFSPDPNIQPSPRKGLLSLDPICLESKNEYIDTNINNIQSTLECADYKGGFQPSKVSKNVPPFSPNNLKTKSLQQQRRNNIQLRRRHSADSMNHHQVNHHQINHYQATTPPHNKHNNHNMALPWTPEDDKQISIQSQSGKPQQNENMVSAALASWQLVVSEARIETNCSPLPPNKDGRNQNMNYNQNMDEQKAVADLLLKSSMVFKSQKDEVVENVDNKPSFSARRSLDKLLTFSGLRKDKDAQSMNNSFMRHTPSASKRATRLQNNNNNNNNNTNNNNNNNITVVPPSRSSSIDIINQPGKFKEIMPIESNEIQPQKEDEIRNDKQELVKQENNENINTNNIIKIDDENVEIERNESNESKSKKSKHNKSKRGKWNKEQNNSLNQDA